MSATKTGPFIRFLGKSWLAGKGVAVYQEGEDFRLRAETTGANPVRYSIKDEDGRLHWRTVGDMVLKPAAYEALLERIYAGIDVEGDVVVVRRALIEMGYPWGDDNEH